MSRLRFLLLLWVFFLPGIKVYGSSETSASVDRMSFNAHWNTPIESMNGTLNLADDYYLTDGTPVTDRNYGEMNNGVLDVTRPNAAHFANRDPRLYSTLFVRGMSWNGKGGEGNWYGGAAASLSMVYVMKYFDPKDTGNSWNNGQDFYVVRYNISIGDGIRPKETRAGMFSPSIHVAGPAKHVLVEHNIIHANAKLAANVDRTMITSDSWDGLADDTFFKQNTFYAAEASRFSMTSSTNNLFDGNWYIGTYQQLPADEKAHTVSETYQKEVLDVDRNGYEGLLMNNRMVCGVKGYFVDKEAIESFFDRCR